MRAKESAIPASRTERRIERLGPVSIGTVIPARMVNTRRSRAPGRIVAGNGTGLCHADGEEHLRQWARHRPRKCNVTYADKRPVRTKAE